MNSKKKFESLVYLYLKTLRSDLVFNIIHDDKYVNIPLDVTVTFKDNHEETEKRRFKKWLSHIDDMIYCFEDNDYITKPQKNMTPKESDKFLKEMRTHNKRVKRGARLFGKYYCDLVEINY